MNAIDFSVVSEPRHFTDAKTSLKKSTDSLGPSCLHSTSQPSQPNWANEVNSWKFEMNQKGHYMSLMDQDRQYAAGQVLLKSFCSGFVFFFYQRNKSPRTSR